MQYRKFGKLDWMVSALGFGCMRFPTKDSCRKGSDIREKYAISLIRYAIDQGVNYFDTAYSYHYGNSEVVVGKALHNGYRNKVKLATKSPVWLISKTKDFDIYLNIQLKRLQTDHIDFYLFHGVNNQLWKSILHFDLLQKAELAIKDGRIGYIGFSFHDNYNVFKEIINTYSKWALAQIQYNFLDTEIQAGTKGLKYAASKGMAVVVMGPLLGGRLSNPPTPIRSVYEYIGKKFSPSDIGLRWVLNHQNVSVVLSGMNTLKQVKENIISANNSGINVLEDDILHIIEIVKNKYVERMVIPCTKCGYCMPCPNNVNIPNNIEMYNDLLIHEDINISYEFYSIYFNKEERAVNCTQCRLCEIKCPQNIIISKYMSKLSSLFENAKKYGLDRNSLTKLI